MNRRLVSTTFLSFALLFVQGGSFLIAALCPHLRTGVVQCDMPAQEAVMDHHHMAEMQMDHESDESPNYDIAAFDLPTAPCAHCAVHSRTTFSVFSIRHVEAAKRPSNLSAPLIFERPERRMIQIREQLTVRSHGPPGDTVPRHILIDVYRI